MSVRTQIFANCSTNYYYNLRKFEGHWITQSKVIFYTIFDSLEKSCIFHVFLYKTWKIHNFSSLKKINENFFFSNFHEGVSFWPKFIVIFKTRPYTLGFEKKYFFEHSFLIKNHVFLYKTWKIHYFSSFKKINEIFFFKFSRRCKFLT